MFICTDIVTRLIIPFPLFVLTNNANSVGRLLIEEVDVLTNLTSSIRPLFVIAKYASEVYGTEEK